MVVIAAERRQAVVLRAREKGEAGREGKAGLGLLSKEDAQSTSAKKQRMTCGSLTRRQAMLALSRAGAAAAQPTLQCRLPPGSPQRKTPRAGQGPARVAGVAMDTQCSYKAGVEQ